MAKAVTTRPVPVAAQNENQSIKNSKCLGITITEQRRTTGVAITAAGQGGEFFNGKDDDPIVATYEYTDEDGKVLSRKVRTATKKFLATKTRW